MEMRNAIRMALGVVWKVQQKASGLRGIFLPCTQTLLPVRQPSILTARLLWLPARGNRTPLQVLAFLTLSLPPNPDSSGLSGISQRFPEVLKCALRHAWPDCWQGLRGRHPSANPSQARMGLTLCPTKIVPENTEKRVRQETTEVPPLCPAESSSWHKIPGG